MPLSSSEIAWDDTHCSGQLAAAHERWTSELQAPSHVASVLPAVPLLLQRHRLSCQPTLCVLWCCQVSMSPASTPGATSPASAALSALPAGHHGAGVSCEPSAGCVCVSKPCRRHAGLCKLMQVLAVPKSKRVLHAMLAAAHHHTQGNVHAAGASIPAVPGQI